MLAMPLCFSSVHLLFSACRSAARGRSLSPLFVNYFHSHNLTFERSSHSLATGAEESRQAESQKKEQGRREHARRAES